MVANVSSPPVKPTKRKVEMTADRGKYTALGFNSATSAARDGRAYISGSGDAHAKYDREKLIAQSRVFHNDNAIYSGLIERAVNYIASDVSFQSKHKNKKHAAKVEKLWKEFWEKPEIRRLLTGQQVIEMVCREILLTGDSGSLKTNTGFIQLFESEQIKGQRKDDATDGIKKDAYGKPEKFYVSPYGKSGRVDTRNAKPYDPKDFIFVTDPKRPSSTRSVPPSQASFPMIHRVDDTCDSEAIAMQLLSRIAVSITREGGPLLGYGESNDNTEDGENGGNDTSKETELATRLTEIGTALIFHGEPGDKIEGVNHNIPGKNFGDTIRMFLRLLGLPLGLPLEVILLDWTKSNYSQSRAVLEQAYKMFLKWQKLLKSMFLSAVFRWKYAQWVKEGEIKPLTDGDAHEWIMPTFPWLDQLKEAQAHAAKLDRAFTTHAHVCKSQGLDREDIIITREKEIREAIEIAKKIKEDTSIEVPWQHFCGLDLTGATVNLSEIDTSDEDEKPKDKKKDKNKGPKT